jgi:hypothetical protein
VNTLYALSSDVHYPVEQREIDTYEMDRLVDKLAMRPFCEQEIME